MAERKPFLLRLDPALHAQLQRWADDEVRSLNGQMEFLLRDALRRAGRLTRSESALPAEANKEQSAIANHTGDDSVAEKRSVAGDRPTRTDGPPEGQR